MNFQKYSYKLKSCIKNSMLSIDAKIELLNLNIYKYCSFMLPVESALLGDDGVMVVD